MIRVIFWIFVLSSFICSNDIFKPLFPKGEQLKKYILNNPNRIQESLISHNGEFIVTIEGRDSKTMKIWSIIKKKIIYIKEFNSKIKFLSLSHDDNYLIYCKDKKIVSFDLNKKQVFEIINTDESITSLMVSQDDKYTILTSDNHLSLYNMKNKKKLHSMDINDSIQKVQISKQNNFFVVLSKESQIKVYDFNTFKRIMSFDLNSTIKDIDINNNETKIVTLSEKLITFLDIKTGEKTVIESNIEFESIKFMNKSKYIVTCGWSGIYIWDIEKKKNIYKYIGFITLKCSLSDDTKYLVSSYKNWDDLLLFNLITSKITNFNSLVDFKKALYLEPFKQIISIDKTKGIKVWDIKENKLDMVLDDGYILDIDISEDKTLLVASTKNNSIKVWDVKTKQLKSSFVDKKIVWGEIQKVAISKNKKLIAYFSNDIYENLISVKILDVNSLKIINTIPVRHNSIDNFYFIDNKYVVLNSYSKGVEVIDIDNGKIINQIKNKDNRIKLYQKTKFYSIYDYRNDTNHLRNIITKKREDSIKDIKSDVYTVSTYNNQIEIIESKTRRVLKNIYMKKNMDWLIIDSQEKKYYRHIDSNFLLSSVSFNPISTRKPIDKKSIDIYIPNNQITFINNQSASLIVHFENFNSKRLYDIKFQINDNNYTIDYDETLILDKKASRDVKIYIRYNDLIKQSFSKKIELEIFVNGYSQKEVLNIDVKKKTSKEIDIIQVDSTENTFDVTVKNLTDDKLDNVAIFISYKNKIIDYAGRLTIEPNNTAIAKLYKDYDEFFMFERDNLDIRVSTSMFNHYDFNKEIEVIWGIWSIIKFAGIFIIIFFALFVYFMWYDIFYVKSFKHYKDIMDMSFSELKSSRKILERRGDFDRILNEKNISKEDYYHTEEFFAYSSEEKAEIFSNKVNGKLKKIDNDFFELGLDKNFSIKVKKILLYFPSDTNIEKIYKTLENRRSEGILVIAKNEKEQEILSENTRLFELPNVIISIPRNIKMLLLRKEHSLALSQVLALKLDRKIISPYKTKNGVKNELYFFGREKILQHITERELSNYLIVGARQIGKTSLLRALERIFKTKSNLEVISITLSSSNYIRKIARELNMDKHSTIEDIEEYIYNSNTTYLFLIDEVDGFIKSEKKNNYEILDIFRSLSQENRAYFIMAGFWELYYQAVYDYQSPIKNFGEVITIDKLEDEACKELLVKPMLALNLIFKNQGYGNDNDDIAYIINSVGKRANLIASVADEIIEKLDPFKFEIDLNDINRALQSRKVIENCKSWQNLTNNEFKSYIDRLIIYYTIGLNRFTIRKIINLFKKIGVKKVTIDDIKESLDRLELSYILARDGQSYFYTILLFQKHLQREDIKAILDEMIDEFRRKYN